MKALLLIVGFFYGLAAPALAQSTWAAISGQVVDSSRAGIPNAHVKAFSAGSSDVQEAGTDRSGYYSLSLLPPGTYTVQVSAQGFKELTRPNVVLRLADRVTLPLTLEVGDINGKVTVGGDTESLQPATSSRPQRFDSKTAKELPTMGRQVYNLIGLAPGVLFTQEQFGSGGFAGLRTWDANGKYLINGGREGTNQFLLNGAPISLTGTWQFSPSVEAVEEIRVTTNTYDAQFGRTGGGTVNTTLRTGLQSWHGTAYEFLHNAAFDANSSENNRVGAPRGKHITHQFGGTAGGALRKDNDFVLFSFEGDSEVAPYPVVSDTPPLDLRSGRNFVNYGIRVYDPLTARACRDGIDTPRGTACFGTYIRSIFPNNIIPKSRVSIAGRNILALYPEPNAPGLTQNYISSGNSGRYGYVQPIARWDHTFGDKDRFYAVFAYQHSTEIRNSTGFPAPADMGTGTSERTGQNYIAEWTHVLSPNSVLDLRASFGRFTRYFPESACDPCLTADALEIANLPHAPTVVDNRAPHIVVDSATAIIGNSFTRNTENQIDLAPSLTYARGRHILHYGLEFAYNALGNAGPGRANGEFDFTRQWTQQYVYRSRGVLDGSGVADLLLGLPYTGYIDYNDSFYRTWPYYAAYLQDAWKVRPNLTLSLGLRYDVQLPFVERYDRVNQGFDLTSVNPLSGRIIANWNQLKAAYDATNPQYLYPTPPPAIYGGRTFATPKNRRPYDTDWTDLQPRLGFAWSFTPKMVLRAGAGIFYRTATQLNYADGFSQRTSYIRSLDGGLTPSGGLVGPYSLENPFPSGIASPTGPSLGLLTNAGNAIVFDSRARPIPRTYEYSVALQRELPGQVLATAGYAGSVTVHDSFPVALDAVSPSSFAKGTANPFYLNRQLPSPYQGILPATSDLGGADLVTAYNLLRPFPLFNGIQQTSSPMARYRYDSLQLQLEKRVLASDAAGTLTFLFSYTFSKSFEASHRLNDWNLAERPIHELSAQDKPQNVNFAGTWDLPIGWGRRWWNDVPRFAGVFTNGWALDWVLSYSSGYPVDKPDAVFSCDSYFAPGGQTADHWFNNDPKCYQSRPQYTLRATEDRFPNIRTPAAPQLNFSIEKTFWLGEKYLMQFRGEAYNATNTPVFPGPVTNFKDTRFGQLPLQQSNFPRYAQIAAKFVF